MDANDVHKLERIVRRDGLLVVGGMFLGLGIAELFAASFIAGGSQLALGLILLGIAVKMKR